MTEKVEVLITGEDHLSSIFQGIGNAALGLAAGGLAVLGAGLVGLGSFLNSSVTEAIASQNAISQLNAVLESTGGVAGVTSQAAQDLASSLQAVTRFSDEAILGGESLLLTFTNIGQDIFPEATKIMLDMSQALNQDLKSSAIQLGKALQDPILGITALRRVGVNFNETDKELITNLVNTGHVLEAQKFIMAELTKEFGGSAEAAGTTFAGKLDILKNRFSDIKEKLGLQVIPILQRLTDKVIMPLIPFLEKAAKALGDFLVRMEESKDFQIFIDRVSNGLQALTRSLTELLRGNLNLSDIFAGLFGNIALPGTDMVSRISDLFAGLVLHIDWKAIGQSVSENLGALFIGAMDFLKNIDWNQIGQNLRDGWDAMIHAAGQFMMGLDGAQLSQDLITAINEIDWNAVGQSLHDGIVNLIQYLQEGELINDAMFYNFVTSVDWLGIATAINNAFWDFMLGLFGTNLHEIGVSVRSEFANIGEDVRLLLQGALSTIIGDIASLTGGIFGIAGAVGSVVSSVYTLSGAFGALSIPDWLTPGSPTPFEMGLRGIADAMSTVAAGSLPAFSAAPPLAAVGVGSNSQQVVVQVNYSPLMSSASRADVERMIPLIEEGVRRTLRSLNK